MTIDRPEDAARHDTSDVLAGGEVGISREHANRLAPDPPNTGEAPVPPRADVPPEAGGSRRRRQRRSSSGAAGPNSGPGRTGALGRR